jgi:hypothetical protein
MRFDIRCIFWIQICLLIRFLDHALLGLAGRHSDSWCAAILDYAATAYDCSNGITIAQSLIQGLDHDRGNSFSSSEPVGPRIKRIAPPMRGYKSVTLSKVVVGINRKTYDMDDMTVV